VLINPDGKAPPFDFAQGRVSRKKREKWGTRRFTETIEIHHLFM
jgi:hypothetical protein